LYKTAKGDNLYQIAQLFKIDLGALLLLNNFDTNTIIKPGDTILIPRSTRKQNKKELSRRIVYYTVKQGDSMWAIANQFGISLDTLFKTNNLSKQSKLLPGDVVRIIISEES
jgi:LysM repeat protein